MPQALPSGWVDTGITKSGTVSGSAQITLNPTAPAGLSGIAASLNDWTIFDNSLGSFALCDPDNPAKMDAFFEARLNGPIDDAPYLLERTGVECYPTGSRWSGVYGFTETVGPFRLGVRCELIDAGTPQYPQFARHYRLVYRWFGDRTTQKTTTFGPRSATLYLQANGMYGETQAGSEFTPVDLGTEILLLSFGSDQSAPDPDQVLVRFTGLAVDGVSVDTSELEQTYLIGLGGGAANGRGNGSGAASAGGPYRFTFALDVTRNGGPSTGAHLLDSWLTVEHLHSDLSQKTPHQASIQVPFRQSFTVQNVSWETHKKDPPACLDFQVDPGWYAGQDPAWRSDDLIPCLFGVPALTSPATEDAAYRPLSLTFAASVNVQRPDGNRPSDWVSSDPNKITVNEDSPSAGQTLIDVDATGASITRTLVEKWRDWTDKNHGDFGIDRYETTKHNSHGATNQDVWGWESYGYARLNIVAPAAGTLSLTVSGVHLEVSDNHETGSSRTTNFTRTEHAFEVSYDFAVEAGANDVLIDLLLPDTGAVTLPFYYGRVDELMLSGFAIGDYSLTGFSLEAKGDTYFKCDWGPPVQRGDYSALGWSNGGAHGAGSIPDQTNKPDETGTAPLYGGNLRYVEILTGAVSGIIQDSQLSLETFAGKLNQLEGWTATYSQAAFEAANQDSFGNELAPELAQWLRPQVPCALLTPGTAYSPRCSPTVRRICITNCQDYALYMRWPMGHGALEGVALDADGRSPAGVPVVAVRTDTDAVVALGVTDENGYVVVSPVPANGMIDHKLTLA